MLLYYYNIPTQPFWAARVPRPLYYYWYACCYRCNPTRHPRDWSRYAYIYYGDKVFFLWYIRPDDWIKWNLNEFKIYDKNKRSFIDYSNTFVYACLFFVCLFYIISGVTDMNVFVSHMNKYNYSKSLRSKMYSIY